MTLQSESTKQKNPTELLQEQAFRLADIYHAQQEQIELLRTQNERLSQIQAMPIKSAPSEFMHVKIEDINMPFWALVGFLIKLSLASIPAGILIGIIYLIFILIFGGIFGSLLGR